jgi:hypothetical protein
MSSPANETRRCVAAVNVFAMNATKHPFDARNVPSMWIA